MKNLIFLIALVLGIQSVFAQFEPNYDENKVPDFEVPDPLTTFDGKKISSQKQWEKTGRPELVKFFSDNVYGNVPAKLDYKSFKVVEENEDALNGKAMRKQVQLNFQKNGKNLSYTILMYLPKEVQNAPVFLGYNFYGNHTITDDSNVIISDAWSIDNPSFGIVNGQLTEQSRGVRTNRWAIEKIIDGGFGLATIYYGEVDPDRNDNSDGIQSLLYSKDQTEPGKDEWGSVAAWAWGLSRALDYFEEDSKVDESRVIVFGHSRLGKAALWAGAADERFAAVISNNSGCGGAALSKRKFGETVSRINKAFPHWFCSNFDQYNDKEGDLPVDQHELLALIAPRPLYVASAEEDQWADPRGEYLSAYYATPVYELYGKKGMPGKEMPQVEKPVHNTLAYHIRKGKHDVTGYDWDQYIKWAKQHVK